MLADPVPPAPSMHNGNGSVDEHKRAWLVATRIHMLLRVALRAQRRYLEGGKNGHRGSGADSGY
jgi:hypothetical protein